LPSQTVFTGIDFSCLVPLRPTPLAVRDAFFLVVLRFDMRTTPGA
jgi:hypothetical protein